MSNHAASVVGFAFAEAAGKMKWNVAPRPSSPVAHDERVHRGKGLLTPPDEGCHASSFSVSLDHEEFCFRTSADLGDGKNCHLPLCDRYFLRWAFRPIAGVVQWQNVSFPS